jgi:hypothetical protein
LKEALLAPVDDSVFLDSQLTLFFNLPGCGLDIGGVDSGFDRGLDEVFMGEHFERLRFERPPQDLLDLVSRILCHD